MTITFRKLIPRDAAAYRALRLECLQMHPHLFGTTYAEEAGVSELKFERYIRENHPEHFMLGAFADEKLVGMAGFERFARIKTRHKGELVQMFVKPEYTGKEIGITLVKHLLEACFSNPEIEEVKLSVVAENKKAVRLYEKAGFTVFGSEKNYFRHNGRYWDQLFMKARRPT